MITFERATQDTDISIDDINALLPQLRQDGDVHPGSQADMDAIVKDTHVALVLAKDGDKVIGMASVYLAVKFGKKNGFVEDVVIDEAYRGQGLGKKIMEALIQEAKGMGVTQLYLTSKPERIAANKLYPSLGFEKRDTNVYRLKL